MGPFYAKAQAKVNGGPWEEKGLERREAGSEVWREGEYRPFPLPSSLWMLIQGNLSPHSQPIQCPPTSPLQLQYHMAAPQVYLTNSSWELSSLFYCYLLSTYRTPGCCTGSHCETVKLLAARNQSCWEDFHYRNWPPLLIGEPADHCPLPKQWV